MYKLSNDEICFISIILEQGLDNINKDKQAVSIKKEIIESLFKLGDLNNDKKLLKEKSEKYIEKYDKIFYDYLEEKEKFVGELFSKLASMYQIIKEEDTESYDKANYFVTDAPLTEMRNTRRENTVDDED